MHGTLSSLETLDLGIEHTDTVDVALLGMAAQQLLTYADAQYGLPKRADNLVEAAGLQVLHCPTGLALSGKQHAVGLLQLLGIVSQQRIKT